MDNLSPIIMATLYKIKIKTVSPFINYNEGHITEIIDKFLKEYRDPKTGLGFEGTEIDVERVDPRISRNSPSEGIFCIGSDNKILY